VISSSNLSEISIESRSNLSDGFFSLKTTIFKHRKTIRSQDEKRITNQQK